MERKLKPLEAVNGHVNKKSPGALLPPTAPPRTADVKMKDVVAENASESGAKLSFVASTVYGRLEIALNAL